ncbi:MAG: hypothetical protein EBR82_56875 [Caulobacteraceae bacterium]|nr:hypothetical protein [Caulobacteraceae bacterium]
MKIKSKGEFYITNMEELKKAKTFNVYVKTPLNIKLRAFCFVVLDKKRYLADVVTGSLYSTLTGYCMSTPQLKIISKQIAEQL